MKTGRLLGVVLVLQVLLLAGQWFGGTGYLTSANAQITDPGRDRSQMIDELKSLNAKLDKIIALLDGGNLQVKVIQPDENKGKAAGR
ncbi:hypothetical protein [Fontivita pretiosa]|jgi:hypothetical protein|uniref:hypothetical protein n=1 Tax=Fontivita pretiosa TaxID=2989684 RepID=UPI003D17B255